MSELRDRLEALATRGTRRGADAVLDAAKSDVALQLVDGTPEADGVDLSPIDDEIPFVSLEPVVRRGRFGSLVAAAGIAALIGVGALAVTAILGNGGAASPEAAVRQLADAVGHKDPLAAVDVLVPQEVRSLRETVKGITQRAAELKLVDQASAPLAGVDLSVDHLQLATEQLADGYVKVIITDGKLSTATHRSGMSKLLRDALRQSNDTQNSVDLAKLAPPELQTFVVAVRRDGNWYVSPAYTALEYVRENTQGPAASFGSAHPATLGADTPELAVTDALHAWQARNWDRLLALAPPDELPVYDYRAMIEKTWADTDTHFTIDHLSATATVNGDSGIVKLEGSGTTGSDPTDKWQVGGTCPSLFAVRESSTSFRSTPTLVKPGSAPSTPQTPTSADSAPGLCLAGDVGGDLPFGFVFASRGVGDTTSGPVSISVEREDGRWFVSPVTTLLGVADSAIRQIDQRTLYTLLGLGYQLPPDATITLDHPFTVQGGAATGARIYAFDGTAGQELVGAANGTTSASGSSFNGEVFTVDGDNVGSVDFGEYPTSVHLTRTGSYRLVMFPYEPPGQDASLTLWDLAHAPKSVRDTVEPGSTCTSSGGLIGGSVSCSAGLSSSSGTANAPGNVTATTSPLPTPRP